MAKVKKDQSLTLYMTPWQKRMIRDFMPRDALKGKLYRDIDKMIIKPRVGRCPISYKIPPEGIRRGDWIIYLADEQMTMVREFFGAKTPISSINVGPEFLDAGEIVFQ